MCRGAQPGYGGGIGNAAAGEETGDYATSPKQRAEASDPEHDAQ
jgi:hypothetical protein